VVYAAPPPVSTVVVAPAQTVVVNPAQTVYVQGAVYATLPAGCFPVNKGGNTYSLCGNTWFLPAYGASGVEYHVVPAP